MPNATLVFLQNTDIDSSAAEQFSASAPTDCTRVTVKALTTNTNLVYVGLTGVATTTGYPLSAGQTLDIIGDHGRLINAASIYVIAGADNQGAAMACVRQTAS